MPFDIKLVPFIVFGLAALMLLHRRPGKDLLVPTFLIPWTALTPDIGVSMPLAKLLFLLVALKYALTGRLSLKGVPQASIFLAVILIGVGSAIITLSTLTDTVEYVGGDLRNGWLRLLVATSNFALSIIPFVLLTARGVSVSMWSLLRVYVVSVLILCVMGIVQYAIFRATSVDILPLGLFTHAEEEQRSGMLVIGGHADLRPGALAGEPKALGMFAATVPILLLAFGERIFRSKFRRYSAVALALVTIELTQSTSALIALPIGVGVYAMLRIMGRPLPRSAIFGIYTALALGLLAVFAYRVASVTYLTYDPSLLPEPTTAGELLYQRTFGRMEVEDFDWVILKWFIADPTAAFLGRGFGLGHLGTDPFIPDVWRHYMEGRVIFPKTGVTYFFVNGGVVFVLMMMAYFATLTPTLNRSDLARDRPRAAFIRQAQLALIPLTTLLLLRVYVYDVAIFVAAACLLELRPRTAPGAARLGAGAALRARGHLFGDPAIVPPDAGHQRIPR